MRERADSYDEGVYLAVGAKGWLEPRWRKNTAAPDWTTCRQVLETELRNRDTPIGVLATTNLAVAGGGGVRTRICAPS